MDTRRNLIKDKIVMYDNQSSIIAKEIAQNAEDSNTKLKDLYSTYLESTKTHKQMKDNYKKMKDILDTEEYQIRTKRDTIQDL